MEKGYKIYNVTDDPERASNYFQQHIPSYQPFMEYVEITQPEIDKNVPNKALASVQAYWRGLGSTLENLFSKIGRKVPVFLTWADLRTHELLDHKIVDQTFAGAPWIGLVVHPVELRLNLSKKRRLLESVKQFICTGNPIVSRLRALRTSSLVAMYFLDEGILEKARKIFPLPTHVARFPEPVNFSTPDEASGDLIELFDASVLNICVVGFLEKRKGYLNLIKLADRHRRRIHFSFAGPVNRSELSEEEVTHIDRAVSNAIPNVRMIDRKLTDQEVNLVISKADVIYLGYENFFHSSNIQIKAAHFHKPIIS